MPPDPTTPPAPTAGAQAGTASAEAPPRAAPGRDGHAPPLGQGDLLRAAFQFLTRLPVAPSRYDPDWLARGARYFPLVGLAVATIQAAVLLAAAALWPGPVPAVLALAAGLLVTGAFHEDGLADTADGWGGVTAERRLAIMTDSRIGTYGTVALVAALAIQAASLSVPDPLLAAAALVGAGAVGRFAAVVVMARLPYAGAGRKVAHPAERPGRGELVIAGGVAATGLLPLAILAPPSLVPALAGGALLAWLPVRGTLRLLGGHTGDVLGAVATLFATGFLLGAAARIG